ncbi:hypothetical protein F4680DRAFT_132853 [Xylaria scruposa]|nr:hypothetical protein F4680DRAFT_132853 [Xylaria scruposa]
MGLLKHLLIVTKRIGQCLLLALLLTPISPERLNLDLINLVDFLEQSSMFRTQLSLIFYGGPCCNFPCRPLPKIGRG